MTVWMLGLCLMVLLLGGISLDLWRAFSQRRAGASALDEPAYRATGAVRLVPDAAERRAEASLAEQVDRRSLRGSRVAADDQAVVVEVTGSVDFSLLQLLTPGDAFEIVVRATARPQASP